MEARQTSLIPLDAVRHSRIIGHEVRRATSLPLGVQVLAGANRSAVVTPLLCNVREDESLDAHEARTAPSANLHDYRDADALIVGSSVTHGGVWSGPVDESRARALVRAFRPKPGCAVLVQ